MLRLPSRTALMHDQLMRYRTRHVGTKIFFYHGQSQVQTGCHAGRCPDGSVDDENPVISASAKTKAPVQMAAIRHARPLMSCSNANSAAVGRQSSGSPTPLIIQVSA